MLLNPYMANGSLMEGVFRWGGTLSWNDPVIYSMFGYILNAAPLRQYGNTLLDSDSIIAIVNNFMI